MLLRSGFTYKLMQVLSITLFWIIVGAFVELHNAVNYDPVNGKFFLHFIFGRTPLQHLLITSIGPAAGGLLGGSFIVFYQREKLKSRTYARKLLVHSMFYILFVSLSILIVGTIGAALDRASTPFGEKFRAAVFNLRVLRLLITWYCIVIVTIFFLDVSEKYGRGILKRLLLGKYHHPLQEERIFLFLDLKSSTTIAERIGDIEYFRMLKEFFQLATGPILECHGEIYQYVGDEIIITWKTKDGIKKANCLACFFKIREAIKEEAAFFRDRFGTVPDFKAAIHAGMVTTGEIGVIKKDIVYSGDILNTTARIMALCNQYQASLIISGNIYDALKEEQAYEFTYLDSPALRGKAASIPIYRVDRN